MTDPVNEKEAQRTFAIGGGWGHAVGWNGTDLHEYEVVTGRWPFKRKSTRKYRLVYSFGQYPKVGDIIESAEFGPHRVVSGRRQSDPDDMWCGQAEPIDPPTNGRSDG